MLARITMIFLGALAMLVSLAGASSTAPATVQGTIVLRGQTPPPRKVRVTVDQYVCGTEKNGEDLIVAEKNNGVRYAVVWLENPPAVPVEDASATAVDMDQKECMFAPRVVLLPPGGTVNFLNSDRLLHNLHSLSRANPSFNRTQPKGRTIPVRLSQPEIIRLDCDLHSWMRGWVVVTEHPFYAVTNADGAFRLPPVPPGRYALRVWHEKLGNARKEIVVTEGAPAPVILEMTGG